MKNLRLLFTLNHAFSFRFACCEHTNCWIASHQTLPQLRHVENRATLSNLKWPSFSSTRHNPSTSQVCALWEDWAFDFCIFAFLSLHSYHMCMHCSQKLSSSSWIWTCGENLPLTTSDDNISSGGSVWCYAVWLMQSKSWMRHSTRSRIHTNLAVSDITSCDTEEMVDGEMENQLSWQQPKQSTNKTRESSIVRVEFNRQNLSEQFKLFDSSNSATAKKKWKMKNVK